MMGMGVPRKIVESHKSKVFKAVESLKSQVESVVRGNILSFMIPKVRLLLSTFIFHLSTFNCLYAALNTIISNLT